MPNASEPPGRRAPEASTPREPAMDHRQTSRSAPDPDAGECDRSVLHALIEELDECALFTLTPDGRVKSWNEGAVRLWGYREEEIRGEHLCRFFVPLDVAQGQPAEELKRAAAVGRSEHEGVSLRQDGSRFVANMVTKPLRDESGKLYGFAAISRDVTSRRKAELALQESENRFRAFMDNSSTVNCIEDEQGRLTYVDRTFERRFGSANRDCLGATMFGLFPGDVAARLAKSSIEVLRCNEPRELIETIPTAEGETYWLVCKFPFTDSAEQRFVGATAIDITEHEKANHEIEKLNSELEERVSARTAELERTNEELRAFSYSVSHDLRAPLRAIDGFSQALSEDYGDRLDAVGLDFLERVRTEAQRMGQLMDDLLNLFRVSRTELHRSPVDLSEMARHVGNELVRQHPHRPVEFVVQDGLIAEGDDRLLRVVLENLLENAWKFTNRRDPAQIEFGAETSPGGHRVWFVRDNGVGFDMGYVDRLFSAFQRLHADSEFSGTGIGLATVQRIVHRHGGRIWVEASVDKGATFFFTL